MKPIKPYPGHRGKKPTIRRRDPISEALANAQAYNPRLNNQGSVGLMAGLSPYNDNLNRWTDRFSSNAASVYAGNQDFNALAQMQCTNPGLQNVNGPWCWPESASSDSSEADRSPQPVPLVSRLTAAVGSLLRAVATFLGVRFSETQVSSSPASEPRKRAD